MPYKCILDDINYIDYLKPQIYKEVINTSHFTAQQFNKQYNMPLNHGYILYGIQGIGKTYIASGIINTFNTEIQKNLHKILNIFYIQASDIMDNDTQNVFDTLNKIFNEAQQKQPSFIIIDDFQILSMQSTQTQQKLNFARLYYFLNTKLNYINQQNIDTYVLLITSDLQSINQQQQITPQFNQIFRIKIPNRQERNLMIKKLINDATEIQYEQLTSSTPGYIIQDLLQLKKQAALLQIDYQLKKQKLSLVECIIQANKEFQPLAVQQNYLSIPKQDQQMIGGCHYALQQIEELIFKPIKNPTLYKKLGLSNCAGILLYGLPGNGKTMLAKYVASRAEINFISVKGPELLNMYVGESERAIRDLFSRCRLSSPCVLFIDECESICMKRNENSSNLENRLVNTLLCELDGVGSTRDGINVICATNRPELIDKALLRPGRLEKAIKIDLPNEQERIEILKVSLNKINNTLSEEFLSKLSKLIDNYSGADISSLIKQSCMATIENNKQYVGEQEILIGLQRVKRSVTDEMIENFNNINFEYYDFIHSLNFIIKIEAYVVIDFLKEIKEVLDDTNIRGLLNYIWLMLRRQNVQNIRFYNLQFYKQSQYRTLNTKDDKQLLIFLLHMNDLANTQTPERIYKFYKKQILSPLQLIVTYTQDYIYKRQLKNNNGLYNNRNQKTEISYTSIQNLKQRANSNIILDYAETSTPLLPSFYVIRENNLFQIIIRGTNNSYDTSSDIQVDLVQHKEFRFHRGFYNHATGILEILESNQLIQNNFKYEITGHSMGGAISAIVGYLIGEQIGFENVKSFGAGMACCGDMNFSQFSKKFHYTMVNRADIVPSASIHCLKTQIKRMLGNYNYNQNTNSQTVNHSDNIFSNQKEQDINNIDQQQKIYVRVKKRNKKEEQQARIPTKILSQEVISDDDIYPAGNIYHFIDEQIYEVDVHDVSEVYIDYLSFLDHFGYWKVSEWIQEKLQEDSLEYSQQ